MSSAPLLNFISMTAIERTEGEHEVEVCRIIPDSLDSESDSRNAILEKLEGVTRYGDTAHQASIPEISLFNQGAEVGGMLFKNENLSAQVEDPDNARPVKCEPCTICDSEDEAMGLHGIKRANVEDEEVAKCQVPIGNSTKTDECIDDLNPANPVNVIQSKVENQVTLDAAAQSAMDNQRKSSGKKELWHRALQSDPHILLESLQYNKVDDSSKQLEQGKRGQKNMPLTKKSRQGFKNIHGKENQGHGAKNTFPNFELFFIEDEAGSGGYGTVYSAQRKSDGKKFAIKCPHANANAQHANREREMLKRFGGRNFIIKYEGSFQNGNSDCFILQHVEHDRPEVLRREIDVFELQWYGYCMFKALSCLHKEGVVHRDLKPANFLFSRKLNKGYLIDFNLAMDLQQKYSAGKSKLSHKIKLGTKDAARTKATSLDKFREPIPSAGRKELINLVQNAMQSPNHDSMNILGSQRKRVATPLNSVDMKKIHLSPMPLHSAGIAVPGAGLLISKDEKSKKDGPCVGTKGFRAPEALFRSLHQSSKVDIWSAGVTLLYLILGKTPFVGDTEQNIKDIAKLRGSEDLWELAKLHNCESSFPSELLDIKYLPSMDIESWCKKNTKRPDFFKLIPRSLFDLVDKCLTVNPRLRISAEEALQHEFLSQCQEVMKKQRMQRQSLASASARELR